MRYISLLPLALAALLLMPSCVGVSGGSSRTPIHEFFLAGTDISGFAGPDGDSVQAQNLARAVAEDRAWFMGLHRIEDSLNTEKTDITAGPVDSAVFSSFDLDDDELLPNLPDSFLARGTLTLSGDTLSISTPIPTADTAMALWTNVTLSADVSLSTAQAMIDAVSRPEHHEAISAASLPVIWTLTATRSGAPVELSFTQDLRAYNEFHYE